MQSNSLNDQYTTVEDPFIKLENIGVVIQRCTNKTNDGYTIIRVQIRNNYQQLKSIAEQVYRSGIVSKLPMLQF